jgi:hypothetical protein
MTSLTKSGALDSSVFLIVPYILKVFDFFDAAPSVVSSSFAPSSSAAS